MKLNELSTTCQKKLKKVGFDLNEGINEIQGVGNTCAFYMYTPLHYASSIGDLLLVDELLRNKADINQIDETYEMTPIMWAAEYGRASTIKVLLDRGAKLDKKIKCIDKNEKNKTDIDILELAEQSRKPSCLWLFYQRNILGCEVNYTRSIELLKKSGKLN